MRGRDGPQGDQGDPGATGPAGDPGVRGDQGPQGAHGGDQGAQGPQGVAGAQGDQGPQGGQGPAGAQGVAGAQGSQGGVGPLGAQGANGAQGPQGNVGATGPAGAQGPVGSVGAQGSVGPQGSPGAIGPQGAVGPQGGAGVAGPQGPQGAQGAQGPQGSQGSQGAQGATGCATFPEVVDPSCASGLAINATCGQTGTPICLPAPSMTTTASLSMLAFSTGVNPLAPAWFGGASGGTYLPAVVGFGGSTQYAVNVVGLQRINGDAVLVTTTSSTTSWPVPLNVTIRALFAEFVATSHMFATITASKLRIALYAATNATAPQIFAPTVFSVDIPFATSQTGITSPFQHFRANITGTQRFTAGTRLQLYAIAMPGTGQNTTAGSASFTGGLSAGISYLPDGAVF